MLEIKDCDHKDSWGKIWFAISLTDQDPALRGLLPASPRSVEAECCLKCGVVRIIIEGVNPDPSQARPGKMKRLSA
jgi:hypothetical protein